MLKKLIEGTFIMSYALKVPANDFHNTFYILIEYYTEY